MMRAAVAALAAVLAGGMAATAAADQSKNYDPLDLLARMAAAAQTTSFSGTYIHQYGDRVETFRITRISDDVGQLERLESLDGPAREMLRKNDEIACYKPDSKTVRLDKQKRGMFPSLLPAQAMNLTGYYQVKLGHADRVASHDCQWVVLEPKDVFRFSYRYCADLISGLMLKAAMIDDKNEMVERYAFTHLNMGVPSNRAQIKALYAEKREGWRTEHSSTREFQPGESGWLVSNSPPGFKPVMEVERTRGNSGRKMVHMVISDGLAAVSVFIEPAHSSDKPIEGIASKGNAKLYMKTVADHQVTVYGEVPPASLKQIGNSIALRVKSAEK